jgi:hypothetical protein
MFVAFLVDASLYALYVPGSGEERRRTAIRVIHVRAAMERGCGVVEPADI